MNMSLGNTYFDPALDTPTELTYEILYEDAEHTRKRSDAVIAQMYLEYVHAHCARLEEHWAKNPDDPLNDGDPYLLYRCEKDALERVMARRPDMEWGVI